MLNVAVLRYRHSMNTLGTNANTNPARPEIPSERPSSPGWRHCQARDAGRALDAEITKLRRLAGGLSREIAEKWSTVHALDTTLVLLESHISAAGAVRRHEPGYDNRGALRQFLVDILQQARLGLTSRVIAFLVYEHFSLVFMTEEELTPLRKTAS